MHQGPNSGGSFQPRPVTKLREIGVGNKFVRGQKRGVEVRRRAIGPTGWSCVPALGSTARRDTIVRLLALAPVGKGWVVTEDGLQGVVPPHHDPAASGSLPEPVATREMEDLVTCGHTRREVPANSPAGFGRTRSSGNSRAWATVTVDGPVRFTIRRDRPPRASALPG